MIIKFLVSLIPVFLFLAMLVFLDSLKLVNKRLLIICLGWGVVSAGVSYFLNTLLMNHLHMSFKSYSGFVAPVVEEILKFTMLLVLIRSSKTGFMIDAAIYGFSIGAAFSGIENLFYLFRFITEETNPMIWITRGFGTAVMHGGTTAIFGILCMSALNRRSGFRMATIYGALSAILIHGLYNQFLISPVVSTVLIMLVVPISVIVIFSQNEKSISDWLELEFFSEINMLTMIRQGDFSKTRAGCYLLSIKDHFPAEIVVDMYCYISLYLELSVKAKSRIMLKENGMEIPTESDLPGKLNELAALRKSIGRGGCLAMAPVLRMNRKDLWKLTLLRDT